MKKWMLLSLLFVSEISFALPVMNENVANSGVLTIYPDHENPHRFYIAPNVVVIAKNEKGVPHFSYAEFRKQLFTKVGVISMTLMPAYTQDDLEAAKAEILLKDPAAEFTGVPFVNSALTLNGVLPELISSNECNHPAGLIGQEQACSFVLTSKGRMFFLKSLERKTLFTTLQFDYEVCALVRLADGSFQDRVIKHGVAVRIDGSQLAKFPKLIRRVW